jgi:uncharacterized pyridoxal phosphate-containing UPF0001 family protein
MMEENVGRILSELPEGVILVAATKTRAPDEVRQAVEAGVRNGTLENSPRRERRTRRMEFDELSNRAIDRAIERHWTGYKIL